jgi:conjugative relaxase-like TrwC/TraI family protein
MASTFGRFVDTGARSRPLTASLHRLAAGATAGAYYTADNRREARPDRRDEYYAGQGDGVWWSPGGTVVAHGAKVDKDSFRDLCAGLDPRTGQPLVRGAGAGHWAGTDVTLTPGKSVSVLWASGNPRQRDLIEEAHAKSVKRALQFVQDEGLIEVRYGAKGVNSARPKHLIVGTFNHYTSRAGDPNIHTHCVVMNVAGAPPEAQTGRYRFAHLTIDTDRLYVAQLAVGAAYRAELSRQIAALDLETRPAGRGQWELAGVDQQLIEAFSKRSREMEALVGRDASAAQLEVAALSTRRGKDELPTGEALEAQWRDELAALEAQPWRDALDPERRQETTPQPSPEREREMFIDPPDVVGDSPTHQAANRLFKHDTVIGRYVLLEAAFVEAALKGQGPDAVYSRIASLEAEGVLLRLGPEVWTTPEIAACEAALLRAAERPLEREWISPEALNEAILAAPHLSSEQAEATREAGRNDGVSIIEAGAGTGKTTTAKVIVDAARLSGLKVIALAPSWVAADELSKSTKIKAQAIAKWRYDRANARGPALDDKTVLLVDEAGMTGTREMSAILVAAKEAGSKVVLLGDRRQLAAVPGGSALRAVYEVLRRNAVLHGVRRQKVEWQRAASVAMARGDAEAGLRTYAGRDRVLLVDGADAALSKTIQLWSELRSHNGEDVLIATRRNRDAAALNARAREVLRTERHLTGPDVEAPAMDRENKRVSLALSVGDYVRFGETLSEHAIRNGNRARVAAIDCNPDGEIHAAFDLDDGRRIEGPWTSFAAARRGRDPAPPRIVHAYAGTVYAAQGRTVPASVLHVASPTDAREVYVGLTRHTDDAWVVVESARLDAVCRRRQADPKMKPTTNDIKERLFREARQYGEKQNVVDYVDDRLAFARTGEVRTPSDGRSQVFALRAIEAVRAFQRALAWLRRAPIPVPAWLFLDRARERLRELPPALREIIEKRSRSLSQTRGPDRSGPDLGR